MKDIKIFCCDRICKKCLEKNRFIGFPEKSSGWHIDNIGKICGVA
jgi:hypothetical protein